MSAKSSAESESWFTLFSIYEPLIAGWIARSGVEENVISDITQEVLQVVFVELPKFEHNGRSGAFRNWLKWISINRCRRYWDSKKRQVKLSQQAAGEDSGVDILDQLEDPKSPLSLQWSREHDQYVLKRMLELTRSEFDATSFAAFSRNVLQGESPQSIATELGISVGQVYKIKHRILQRLREVADGLVDVVSIDPDWFR
jgi:RNA polymerase sigma-70 factor (ECF subfamily)